MIGSLTFMLSLLKAITALTAKGNYSTQREALIPGPGAIVG